MPSESSVHLPETLDRMWPALIFVSLALVVIVEFIWRERRLRKERARASHEHTERLLQEKQAAHAHAQAQQRALFDSMIDGVMLLDRDGRIQLANPAVRRLFQLAPGGGQGQTILEALRLSSLADLADRLPQESTVLGYELELQTDSARSLEINANAVRDEDGAFQGAILVFHDLTHVKQLEATRKEFVANVSHELRTPLSLIKGFVETLLDGAKSDPDLTTRYLKTIQKHTDRLTYLIEDLLTISRLESGQVLLNLETASLRHVAERVRDDLRSRAAERSVRIENHIPDDLQAWADADRLEQVLFNLVENAIKYGRVSGLVEIRGQLEPNGTIEVSVHDNGPGIPPASQARIFERFYRVDRARSRDTGGTGLGLAIVKHIVLAHGGNVWVESEPDSGTTFHFTLPASPGEVDSATP